MIEMFYYISLIAAFVVLMKFGEIFNPTVPVNSHTQLHSEWITLSSHP